MSSFLENKINPLIPLTIQYNFDNSFWCSVHSNILICELFQLKQSLVPAEATEDVVEAAAVEAINTTERAMRVHYRLDNLSSLQNCHERFSFENSQVV